MARILIVEDDALIARTLKMKLEREGYEVAHCVASGEEAFAHAKDGSLDLVLMDMTLAGAMDGIQTAAVLREQCDVATVYLTARDDAETLARAKHTRPLGYILKPYETEELFRTLELALYNRSVEKALQKKEDLIQILNTNLERRVAERTRELEVANQRIQASLMEKEVLLREIHHRVKNNLQVISSLLRLQSHSVSNPVAMEILKESQNRVRAMGLIHELLYQSQQMGHINIKDYLTTLTTNLIGSFNIDRQRVALSISADDIYLDLDTAIPCGLIVNELLTNVLKHAFPDERAGQVHVAFSQPSDGVGELIIEDNGIGLPEQLNWEKSKTLGFKIVAALAKQISGTLKFNYKAKAGMSFSLTFPFNKSRQPVQPR